MGNQQLGITWLHGRFHAVNLAASPAGDGWTSPALVHTPAEFAAALGDAIRETRFRGRGVTVVLDHRNLLFHVQEAPPARGKMLAKLLDRLVAQSQFFDEAAAHAHVELPESKGQHRHLLALLPQSLVTGLNDACAEHGLRLDALWPAAAVLAPRLGDLPAPASEVVVLATTFGDSMNLLLGRSDGKLLFSRTVALGAASNVERATQEINRTLHYAQQQFGALVNSLFISGADSFHSLKTVAIRAGLKIAEAPDLGTAGRLLKLATGLSPRAPLNFARHPGSRHAMLRTCAAAGIAAALAASVVITAQVETRVRARASEARTAERSLRLETDSLAAAGEMLREAHRLQGLVHKIGSTNDPPVIDLFARSLPSWIPGALRLTEVSIEESPAGWNFTLKGAARPDNTDPVTWMEQFEGEMEKGPFQVRITDSTYRKMLRGETDSGIPSGSSLSGRNAEVPVFISGVIE